MTEAFRTLSAQSETERRCQSEQVKALRRRVERLSKQVTRVTEYYGMSGTARPRGRWI